MTKLKPCHFCRGDADVAVLRGTKFKDNVRYFCYCEDGCVDMPRMETKKEATEAWNRRGE